jgi:LmbE family N-acetylglucosaminyl deacetylase
MSGTVVVAPHPDDEVLGCAAVLYDGSVMVVHVTDGVPPWTAVTDRAGLESRRQAESAEAWACLSSQVDCVRLGFGDLAAWQAVPEIADSLTSVVDSVAAEAVYLPAYQRGHPDHDATYLAGALARRNLAEDGRRTWWVYGLYGFDESRRLRFGWLPPAAYDQIEVRGNGATLLAAKVQALGCYVSQLWPDSALDLWIRDPVPEEFAPLPSQWDRLADLPCFYDEELGFGRHGASASTVESAFQRALGTRA